MLHDQSFQSSDSPQAHQQGLAPLLSGRRSLPELNTDSGSAAFSPSHRSTQPSPKRRGRLRSAATNQEALEAFKRCSDETERRALREQLVRNNLPLVYAVTARMGRTLALPLEDLRQVGSLGLLRAIEAYEPARGRTLSSFAVPYIRGAIQHELRDRASLMRIPRPLWELRRRASVLQDRRRRLGQPQLAPAQLAEALGCATRQVVEALQLAGVVEMRSLDAPSNGESGDDAKGRTLLELLADPASLDPTDEDAGPSQVDAAFEALWSAGEALSGPVAVGSIEQQHTDRATRADRPNEGCEPQQLSDRPITPERFWLRHRLQALTWQERQLLHGHVGLGRSWAELGRELALHPRQVQRRTVALLRRLEAEAKRWREGDAMREGPV